MRLTASVRFLTALLAACAPRGGVPEGSTTPPSGAGAEGGAPREVAPAAMAGEDRLSLGPSELTPLAEGLAGLSLAALRGRPLPDVGLPIEPHDPQLPQAKLRRLVPPVPPLEVVAVVFADVRVALDGGDLEGLEMMPAVTRRGLRLFGVERHRAEACAPSPALEGLQAAAGSTVAALREGRSTELLLGHGECMEDFGSERICEEALEDVPSESALTELRAALGQSQVRGVSADEVIVVARTAEGRIVGLVMRLDCGQGGVVIESNPVVEASSAEEQ